MANHRHVSPAPPSSLAGIFLTGIALAIIITLSTVYDYFMIFMTHVPVVSHIFKFALVHF